jgi:hypothetical protein
MDKITDSNDAPTMATQYANEKMQSLTETLGTGHFAWLKCVFS